MSKGILPTVLILGLVGGVAYLAFRNREATPLTAFIPGTTTYYDAAAYTPSPMEVSALQQAAATKSIQNIDVSAPVSLPPAIGGGSMGTAAFNAKLAQANAELANSTSITAQTEKYINATMPLTYSPTKGVIIPKTATYYPAFAANINPTKAVKK